MAGERADLAHLSQGERIIVRMSGLSHQERTTALVLDDALPAGFEIETKLGPEDGAGDDSQGSTNGPYRFLGHLDAPSAQEARDDRYVAALTVGGGKGFTVAYVARAVTPGDFFQPGLEAHDMYRADIFARTASGRAQIKAAGP